MADRNPILKSSSAGDVQFSPQVLDQKITNAVSSIPTTTGVASISMFDKGTITSFNTGTGTGYAVLTSDSSTVSFINATRENLTAGNIVAIIKNYDGNYYAIAIIYTTSETPSTIPTTIVPYGYPADVSGGTYKVASGYTRDFTKKDITSIDTTGAITGHIGSLIAPLDWDLHFYNPFNGQTGYDTALPHINYDGGVHVQPDGRIFISDYYNNYIYTKAPSGTFVSPAKSGRRIWQEFITMDRGNGWVWFWDWPTGTTDYTFTLNYWRPGDADYTATSYVIGNGGSNANIQPTEFLYAGNGKLNIGYVNTAGAGGTTYTRLLKNSNDSTSPTISSSGYTDSIYSTFTNTVGGDGTFYYAKRSTLDGYWYINSFGATSFNTMLPYSDVNIQKISISHNGTILILGTISETQLGIGSALRFYPLVATTNMSTTSIMFYDPDMVSQTFNNSTDFDDALHTLSHGSLYDEAAIFNTDAVQYPEGTMTWATSTRQTNYYGGTYPSGWATYYKEKVYQLTGL